MITFDGILGCRLFFKMRLMKIKGVFLSSLIMLLLVGCVPNTAIIQENYYEALGDITVGQAVTVESVSYDKYAYSHLDAQTQQVYDQILKCIMSFDEKVKVSTLDPVVIDKAYYCITYDYPNIFWIEGYQYNTYYSNDTVVSIEVLPKYTMSLDEKNAYQLKIDSVVRSWLEGIDENTSDYEKAEYVFTKLIEEVEYDESVDNSQNIISAFLEKRTVCHGYTDAASYMLEKLNIPSMMVTGTAKGEPHSWNLIYLDGAYYYMDVTWGNSQYRNGDNELTKRIRYAYMAMTSEELSSTHYIDMKIDIPECLSNADNYYVKNRRYFDTWDTSSIGQTIGNSYDAGEEYCAIKFSNPELYQQAIQYYVNDMHVVDWCWGLEKITYLTEDDVNVLTFKWR